MAARRELFVLICLFVHVCVGSFNNVRVSANSGTYNVKDFGAKANGVTDDSQAFVKAWKAACNGTGLVKLWVPAGTYSVGQMEFNGPCPNVKLLIFQIEGTLKAVTDLNKYKGTTWVQFGWVNNMLLAGGTFDGQGEVSWPFNQCPKHQQCKLLPTSISFVNGNNITLKNVKSLNSKLFHMSLLNIHNFDAIGLTITAPKMSPNTDGIHIERSTGVKIRHSNIGTGDDCISIGQGNTDVEITNVNCGPGHGISVGSLGKRKDEGDVKGLVVRDCTLTGTDNGVRIKTWENSPITTVVQNMTFDNIIMNDVLNPIIIDQTYCPYASCDTSAPSRVKISDITFKNIRGTSKTLTSVILDCSRTYPCHNVKLEDIHLTYTGDMRGTANATCNNVRATYVGIQNPPPCS